MRVNLFAPIISLLILCACATAPVVPAHYVAADDVPPTVLPAPQQRNTIGFIEQIKYVVAAQQNISPKDLAALRNEQQMRISLVTDTLGPNFTAANYPQTFMLLQNVYDDASPVIANAKEYWDTPRPYLAYAKYQMREAVRLVKDDRVYGDTTHPYMNEAPVRLLVDPIDNPAYPSGHTAQSRLLAEILAQLFPTCKIALVTRADEIAGHRIQAGVHYPMDIAAGRQLAVVMLDRLATDTAFQADLAAAQAEIANTKGSLPTPFCKVPRL